MPPAPPNLLVVCAHPARHRSRINARLAETAQSTPDTGVVDLYDSYPDFEIDVTAEKKRLEAARIVVLQHPMYWYSCPALLKEWIDLVFEYGWAYGQDGRALQGKLLAHAISTGGDEQAYARDGFNRYSISEFLRPFEATAHFCGMRWQPPFVTHGGHLITGGEIERVCGRYATWLRSLQETA